MRRLQFKRLETRGPKPIYYFILSFLLNLFTPSLWAASPTKPPTSGYRVLVVYSSDFSGSSGAAIGNSGLVNLLSSAGAFAGLGFQFTVETIAVPCGTNASSAGSPNPNYATDPTVLNTAFPLNASNYCAVFDLRFCNLNHAQGAVAGQIAGDTIVQADVNAYASYLASGGGLFVWGDNYYDSTLNPPGNGFITRMETMYNLIDTVAATGIGPNSNAFGIDSAGTTGTYPATPPYNLGGWYNNLAGMGMTTFPVVYDGAINVANIGSAQTLAMLSGNASEAIALAWQGSALKPAYSAGRMVYWGDTNEWSNWGTNGVTNTSLTYMMENIVDFLDACSPGTPTPSPTISPLVSATITPTPGCQATVAYDNDLQAWSSNSGANPWTSPSNFTPGAGSQQVLLVAISGENACKVTSVNFGSQALSFLMATDSDGTCGGASTDMAQNIYYLLNPSSTPASITVNFSASPANVLVISAFTYSGVGSVGNSSAATGSSGASIASLGLASFGLQQASSKLILLSSAMGGGPLTSPNFSTSPGNARYTSASYSGNYGPLYVGLADYAPGSLSSGSLSYNWATNGGGTVFLLDQAIELTASNAGCTSPTSTKSPTATITPSSTSTPSATPSFSRTFTFTNTASPSFTASNTPSPTPSSSPSATPSSTASFTPSLTASPSSTPSASPSSTPTYSPTPSPSNTYTLSSTPSVTPSSTPSPTATPSFTSSDTPSSTPTHTSSSSPSATPTNSPTKTFTPSSTSTPSSTASLSPSDTPSSSPTDTASPSATASGSPSKTPSYSPTATQTFQASPTSTATISITSTPTFTETASPSSSPSFTASLTFSSTPSFTSTLSASPTPTQTFTFTASASFTFSFTPSVTPSQSYSFSPSPSFSATPSTSNTASYTITPTDSSTASATSTGTPSSTPSLSFTQSSTPSSTPSFTPTATPSVSFTNTPSITASASSSSSATASASPSASPTPTPTFSASPTPVPVPFALSVTIYNSAGELVRSLYQGAAQTVPQDVALIDLGQSFQLNFPTLLQNSGSQLLWDLGNNSGQQVAPGPYSIKIETKDNFGRVNSLVKTVSVMPDKQAQCIHIYNSAGELVASLGPSQLGLIPSGFYLNGSGASLSIGSRGQGVPLQILDANGASHAYIWDGKNSLGQYLQSGVYTLQFNAGGQVFAQTVNLSLAPASAALSRARLLANPAQGSQLMLTLPGFNFVCWAQLYNLAGQQVAQGSAPAGATQLALDISRLASGGYVLDLETRQGSAVLQRVFLKVAVLH